MIRHAAAVATILLASVVSTFAKEPHWTDEERAQRSSAVFTGRVVSVERVEPLNDDEDLYRALITVEAVSKGPEVVGKEKISVYFERPIDGRGGRCPDYVELKERQRANFFLQQRKIGSDLRPFLEMGSDVRDIPAAEIRIAHAATGAEDSRQAATTAKGRGPTPSEDIVAAVGRLGRLKPGAETEGAVAALALHGDAAVAEIGRQLADKPPFGLVHTSVRVLKKVNTAKSRELLRRIAMGELGDGNPNNAGWAASALVACDRDEAWMLLSSTTPEVLLAALGAVKEGPIDEPRLALLKTCLTNTDYGVSWRTADVMTRGSTGKIATEAVEAITAAITGVASRPDAMALYRKGGDNTVLEMYCSPYIQSLTLARVDNQFLHQLASQMRDRARDAAIIALGERGDASVQDELVNLAQDPDAGRFREFAVLAMGEIGTQTDFPLLRKLAREDPLIREGFLRAPHPTDSKGPTYPVREAAERSIRMIEKRIKKGGSRDANVVVLGVFVLALTGGFTAWVVIRRKRIRPGGNAAARMLTP
jgi:HEAT repeat protein